ncbi:unnamed protein product [Penicillium pancosmium]
MISTRFDKLPIILKILLRKATGTMSQVPTTRSDKVLLAIVGFLYLGFGVVGIVFAALDDISIPGDADTLTSVLAVLGVVYSLMSIALLAECKSAALQYAAKQATGEGLPLRELNEIDVALRGPTIMAVSNSWNGILYRAFLPVLATLMSATFKKCLTNGYKPSNSSVGSPGANFIEPTNVGSYIRGAAWAGAILYNTTSSITSSLDSNQTSWNYITANESITDGQAPLQFSMPSLPQLVAAGTVGYSGYTAFSAPALTATTRCFSGLADITGPNDGIQNGNYNITAAAQGDGTSLIQVSSIDAAWACTSTLSDTSGPVTFVSDKSGNWNISQYSPSLLNHNVTWTTTDARLRMLSSIISDVLGTAADYSGWDWNSDDMTNQAYTYMLLASQLSSAAATLSFSETRAQLRQINPSGIATSEIETVVVLKNWALYLTMLLLLFQSFIVFLHIRLPGRYRIDFSFLQIMEMCREAALLPEEAALPGEAAHPEEAALPGEAELPQRGCLPSVAEFHVLVSRGLVTLALCSPIGLVLKTPGAE